MQTELERLQESTDFWRARANAFEEALRLIAECGGVIESPKEIAEEVLARVKASAEKTFWN